MSQHSEQHETFLKIIGEHSPLIYKVCYMYAEDSEHLKDLYQEVTANIWQGLENYRGESKVSTWIYRIAINTCVSFIRRNGRHSSLNRLDEEAYSLADRNDEHAELLREMYGMISQLGKLDRAIIMLWLDEYSYEEIAQLTGLSRNNVASRLHRAKERLATTET